MPNTKLDRQSSRTLYYQLKQILKTDIETGIYQSGEKLPTKNELVEMYGTCRCVVKQAIKSLIKEELIYSHQGLGYFVNQPPVRKALSQLSSHTESMSQLDRSTKTLVTCQEKVKPPRFVAEYLLDTDSKKAIFMERGTHIEDERVCLINGHYPDQFAPIFLIKNLDNNSIYAELKRVHRILPVKAKTTVSVKCADKYQSDLLQKR